VAVFFTAVWGVVDSDSIS